MIDGVLPPPVVANNNSAVFQSDDRKQYLTKSPEGSFAATSSCRAA